MPIISGTVFDDTGNPVAGRIVRAYRRDTGALLAETLTSDGISSADPHWDKVALLLHMDGVDGSTNFNDSSPRAKAITASGNAKVSSAQSKFGGSSAYFDGNGAHVNVSGGEDFDLGTVSTSSNFTVEFWYCPSVVDTNLRRLVAHALPGSGSSGRGGWSLYTESGFLRLVISATSTATNPWYYRLSTSSAVFTAGVWCHVACVLSAGIPKLYINGVSVATTVDKSTAIYASTPIGLDTTKTDYGLRIGASFTDPYNPNPSDFLAGYIDDLRITKGVSRYTANFTPPAGPFPNQKAALPLGKYKINTTYTGECNVICLDDNEGTTYNDLILRTTPV